MAWVIVALILVGILTAVAFVFVRRRAADEPTALEPLFYVGMPLSGAGAALIATNGPLAFALVGLGVALMVIGAVRSRNREE